MATYEPKSRYAKTETYLVTDHRGRSVTIVGVPPRPGEPVAGIHLLRQGQRPDLLASQYLADPAGFWRIAEANDAMSAEVLTEQAEITIPVKGTR